MYLKQTISTVVCMQLLCVSYYVWFRVYLEAHIRDVTKCNTFGRKDVFCIEADTKRTINTIFFPIKVGTGHLVKSSN